jgi:hypothetical protein
LEAGVKDGPDYWGFFVVVACNQPDYSVAALGSASAEAKFAFYVIDVVRDLVA